MAAAVKLEIPLMLVVIGAILRPLFTLFTAYGINPRSAKLTTPLPATIR